MLRAIITSLVTAAALFAQSPKLKIFISVDMEGVAGVATADQLSPGSFEYERFRGFMTRETLAAVNAARAAGATDIVVADSHGNGENLLIEQFPPQVRIVRSWPRHLGMMGGIDSTFDAAMFVGYHASTHNPKGVRAHTFSSARLARVAMNGINVTEGAWNAAIAGHFNVPVIFVSGDDAAIAEIRAVIGNIEAAETKRALGFHSTETLIPEAAQELIREHATAALRRLKEFKVYKATSPVTVDVTFKSVTPAETAAYLKMFERTNSHSIRYVAKDMVEASDIMEFLEKYKIELEP